MSGQRRGVVPQLGAPSKSAPRCGASRKALPIRDFQSGGKLTGRLRSSAYGSAELVLTFWPEPVTERVPPGLSGGEAYPTDQ
jgi:hypothetical protein